MSASTDISSFLKGLGEAKRRARAAALRAMDQAGEHVIGDAQQLTPVDTGALQASGTTEPAKLAGDRVSKRIGFNTEYAAAVHEVLTSHHEIGQAKFLETAMRRSEKKVVQFIVDEMKKAL